jgi:hypothetical protein
MTNAVVSAVSARRLSRKSRHAEFARHRFRDVDHAPGSSSGQRDCARRFRRVAAKPSPPEQTAAAMNAAPLIESREMASRDRASMHDIERAGFQLQIIMMTVFTARFRSSSSRDPI